MTHWKSINYYSYSLPFVFCFATKLSRFKKSWNSNFIYFSSFTKITLAASCKRNDITVTIKTVKIGWKKNVSPFINTWAFYDTVRKGKLSQINDALMFLKQFSNYSVKTYNVMHTYLVLYLYFPILARNTRVVKRKYDVYVF